MKGAQHQVVFSEAVSQWLKEFNRQEGATLFMTLMAGFHALLWRYTGQNDILVGTPIAGRSHCGMGSRRSSRSAQVTICMASTL